MTDRTENRWVAAGILLGTGLGGFVDGILFHQILQLHSMLSNRRPPTTLARLEANMVWDGLFHAFCLGAVLAGLVLSWRVLRRAARFPAGRAYAGAMLAGWGLFNLVEGIINHHLLALHHVHQYGNHLLWDLMFLASGVALIAGGRLLMRGRDVPRPADPDPAPRRPATQRR